MDIVSLLEGFVNDLFEAEAKFYQNPKDFCTLETNVKSMTEAFAASFLSECLTSINQEIYDDGLRKTKFVAQRRDKRTLITSVGDVVFESTYYRKKADDSYHYLTEELIGLGKHERFSECAEAVILGEALKTSYAEAAKVLPSKQEITKTTVMNKVHKIAREIPCPESSEKKKCKYLFVEADEDHVAEQHGRWNKKEENSSFISKLAYVYEYKQDNPKVKGRKELVNTFYFSGVYEGSKENRRFWENVDTFIENNYDTEELEQVFISGDGASWIKSGTDYVYKGLFCVDKYHTMKYINAAANQMLDEKEIAKSELYRMIYKRSKKGMRQYINKMLHSANNTEPVEKLESFMMNHWDAIMRTYHNPIVSGCSAESHVSHILSDRLSSRPMGWSQRGADRMSKLRCYEKNYGREKIIELVKYSRERKKLARTGTDCKEEIHLTVRLATKEHHDAVKGYIDRIQATIPGLTARKSFAIREQIRLI